MKRVTALIVVFLAGCAEVSYQSYSGTPKPDSEVAIVRLWTPTTTNVFTSPGLLMKEIDGRPAGDVNVHSGQGVQPAVRRAL